MSAMTEEEMHDQMMRWGQERDDARDELARLRKNLDALAAENARLRRTLTTIGRSAEAALDATPRSAALTGERRDG